MTTPPSTPAPLNTTDITALLLTDGWHKIQPGSVPYLFTNPQFEDPFGGPPDSVGGQWLWWTDDAGQPHGTPIGWVQDVQWNPPVTPQVNPLGEEET
jgi:hypothetical protein